ncbi:M23 family metallopeptidase [Arthrobacter sp. CAU 1506]|nr:M23 family metallopeptidase [Arthrobacter sp. CAU 1506]
MGAMKPPATRCAAAAASVMLLLAAGPAAPATSVAADPADAPWSWPASPAPAVLRGFDPPPEPWLSGHRGVDLAVPAGTAVLSPADGRISFSGWVVDRRVITINHGDGLRSSLLAVASDLQAGDTVSAGDSVGTVAEGGHCPTACLHWGVRRGETYINPLQFVMDLRPSVLLAVPDG